MSNHEFAGSPLTRSAGNYAGDALSLIVQKPVTLFRLGWFSQVTGIAAILILVGILLGPALFDLMQTLEAIAPEDTGAMSDAYLDFFRNGGVVSIILAVILTMFISSLMTSVPAAAYARYLVLGEDPGGVLYINVGGREVTIVFTILLVAILMFLPFYISLFGTMVLFGVAQQSGAEGAGIIGGVMVFVTIAMFFASIYIFGRLAMAVPISAVEGGLGIGRAWSRTKNYGGKFFGLTFLATIAIFVVQLVCSIAIQLVLQPLLIFSLPMDGTFQWNPMFTVILVVYALYFLFVNLAQIVIYTAAFAIPYKEMREPAPVTAPEAPAS